MKVTPALTIFVVLFLFLHFQMHVDLCLWLINQNARHYNTFIKANANAVYDTPLACLSTSAGLQHSCPKHVPSLTLKRFTTHQSLCFLDWTSHDISSFALWHTQVSQTCQHRADTSEMFHQTPTLQRGEILEISTISSPFFILLLGV